MYHMKATILENDKNSKMWQNFSQITRNSENLPNFEILPKFWQMGKIVKDGQDMWKQQKFW